MYKLRCYLLNYFVNFSKTIKNVLHLNAYQSGIVAVSKNSNVDPNGRNNKNKPE